MWTSSRREFLKTIAGAPALSLWPSWDSLAQDGPPADSRQPSCDVVRFDSDIEPLVRLIEESRGNEYIGLLVGELRKGLSYRRFLTALFLASLRQNNFDHPVYMVHSANQLSLDLDTKNRLLPLFAQLWGFKFFQAKWPAKPLTEFRGKIPPAREAASEFAAGMKEWDPDRSERALIALSRSFGPHQAYEAFLRHIGRDWVYIGHKAIAIANCWRALLAVGMEYAEPVLRYALREQNLAEHSSESAEVFNGNAERVEEVFESLPADWVRREGHAESTRELVEAIRKGKVNAACELATKRLVESKVSAWAIWDAVHVAAAELMIRHRGWGPNYSSLKTGPVHANTSANALHYAFRVGHEPRTRLLNLLQGVAWVTRFSRVDEDNLSLRPLRVTELEEATLPDSPRDAVEEMFWMLPISVPESTDEHADRSGADEASRKAFQFCRTHPDSTLFLDKARDLIVRKTTEVHEYKFPIAIFEDYGLVSPEWRPHMLAGSVHLLKSSRKPDLAYIEEVRTALRRL